MPLFEDVTASMPVKSHRGELLGTPTWSKSSNET